MPSVYNATDGPLLVDDDGHVLGGREHQDEVNTRVEPARGHVREGRLIVTGAKRSTPPAPAAQRVELEQVQPPPPTTAPDQKD